MDAEEFFCWLKENNYCESPYDGRNEMSFKVIHNSMDILHDAEKRRNLVFSTFELLKEDDAWCRSEVKRIRTELNKMKMKVGYKVI